MQVYGIVYFIKCLAGDCPIKIGFTKNLDKRLKTMQVSSPFDLVLLRKIPGSFDVEHKIKNKFKHLHIRGEWYMPGDDLLAYIDQCKAIDQDEGILAQAHKLRGGGMAGGTRKFNRQ